MAPAGREGVLTARQAMARGRLAAWRRRRERRGATVFLVILVMTLLSALGIFASRATSLAGRASGYLRQSDQSHYLMQHALILAMNEIDRGSNVYGVRNPNSNVTNQKCTTNAAYPAVKLQCTRFETAPTGEDVFQAAVKRAQQAAGKPLTPPIEKPGNANLDPNLNTPGSLGPWMLLPSMYVEMTDLSELDRTPPGYQVAGNNNPASQFRFRQATLVGIAQIGPYPENGPTLSCTDPQEKSAATVVARQAGRGQITFGPI